MIIPKGLELVVFDVLGSQMASNLTWKSLGLNKDSDGTQHPAGKLCIIIVHMAQS